MSREVRMVPPGWQPPTYFARRLKRGISGLWDDPPETYMAVEFRPLYGGSYAEALDDFRRCPDDYDVAPDPRDYMPEFPDGTATHLMMFETCSEGTPISPAFATPEELARWLTDNDASAFGGDTATYDQWLRVCRGGWAPSAVIINGGPVMSGVAAMSQLERNEPPS